MTIEFTGKRYEFQENGKRKVVGEFDGATITSNAGVLLLRELEEKSQVLKEFAECFTDYRNVEQIEHTVEELVKQRTYGIVLGYEDLIDHDELRLEPLLAVVVGKIDPTVMDRKQLQDQGKALAGKSTLNRLELRSDDPKKDGRYKKIAANTQAIDKLMVEHFIKAHNQAPKEVILDLDTTENKIHGNQEGRFYRRADFIMDIMEAIVIYHCIYSAGIFYYVPD
ncbi:MAG: transposase family protein [bacterium]|nr:MAG: transposase family protein [bacterium]